MGRPISIIKTGSLPKPFAESKASANIKLIPSVQKQLDKAVSPVKREIPFFSKLSPEQQASIKVRKMERDDEKNFALDRDTKFLQKAKKIFPKGGPSPIFGEGGGFAGFRRFRG
jgi:hypothetical protein